jgi:aspartyl-tRNA(Asn)/glutamyl-tRNA(Gln) amidotransferase subunit C
LQVDRELVLHIADLAHLQLTEDEVQLFARQLQQILHYIEKLNELTETSAPFSFGEYLSPRLRSDTVEPSLPVEDALRNAPQRAKRLFKVPKILP